MKNLRQLMDLTGRVAVITGGAGHVGRAMGDALAELGASIVVLDVNHEAATAAADAIAQGHGGRALPLVVDLAVEADVRRVPQQVADVFGRLDVLINNAALVGTSALTGWGVPFAEQTADTWRAALEVNLTAPFVLTKRVANC
jgi:NAD(P)-dependent dehydrogenase (short-subunit alcohol dehydrogenase family)